jgi:aminoglycoside phosphotransferase (APT) family kinase protein
MAVELIDAGLLLGQPGEVSFTPLSGGVSSDIFLVSDGSRALVVKRALPKLKVKDDWYADTSRNRAEHEYLSYVAKLDPRFVPRVLYKNDKGGFFAMEFLGEGYATWKSLLLERRVNPAHAVAVGQLLGKIHSASWLDEVLRADFDNTELFVQLRVDPYLITTGKRTPALQDAFFQEADRLVEQRLCLVHGDYSPKNILVSPDRLAIVDCEVAWFGDPTFDVCFLVNHLFLKAVHNDSIAAEYLCLANRFWQSYVAELGADRAAEVERHVPRLLLMLMLARVDGKSPVEYLTDEGKRQAIRDLVTSLIQSEAVPATLTELGKRWLRTIQAI